MFSVFLILLTHPREALPLGQQLSTWSPAREEAGGRLWFWTVDTIGKGQLFRVKVASVPYYSLVWEWPEGKDSRILPWPGASALPSSPLCILAVLSSFVPPHLNSIFSFLFPHPPPRSSPCDGSFCFGLSTSKGQRQLPWASALAKPSRSICSFPCRGQRQWVKVRAHGCGGCVHVYPREWDAHLFPA